ncbi:uncharacterized protein [Drosophila bipectinata]|uniref:uncharacterized protein n=1 Tax=Drosophila bipectinata TaxID=42026 RepID=UPI001C89E82B|nr:uncharacterized protein LOC108132014 [Drosophila bipectinata]
MKAAIVLALISSVLAAPPVRVQPRPGYAANVDQYAHIFAQVRPSGNHKVEVEVKPEEYQPLANSASHLVELEVRPVDQKPPQLLEIEIKQEHQPQHQNPAQGHFVELEFQQQSPQTEVKSPNHLVELEIKPVEPKPTHLEIEIKQQPQQEKEHHHQDQNLAQGHLVPLKSHVPKVEFEAAHDMRPMS